ncbi:hypothetical protein F1880_003930 [Penicillium rolfsii]|nr:hypothetical protein F1880_003930 [Penicillium rolfsii]
MSIIPATIPIPVLPIPTEIIPIFIPSPFDQCPAVNPDPKVVISSTAERPGTFPGTIPSDVEEVTGQRGCEEKDCGCECVELHCGG